MSKFWYFLIPVITFGLGYLIADFKHIHTTASNHDNVQERDAKLSHSTNEQLLSSLKSTINTNIQKNKALSLSEQEQIKQLIMATSENKIENYLQQAFPEQDFDKIHDKKKFAQRIIDELNHHDESTEPLNGQLIISTTPVMPDHTMNIHEIHKHQEIFAHFDTFGKVPNDTQIFIKWINQNTNEVLLFTPKYIQSDQTQNWVSMVPNKGWKIGRYHVKVFQMDDHLIPIAQVSYTLTTIL